MKQKKPVIGVASSIRFVPNRSSGLKIHSTPAPYIDAIQQLGGFPLIIPTLGECLDLEQLFSLIDGVILTGAITNVHPNFYHGTDRPSPPYDVERDQTAFALIRETLKRKTPLLAICRGAQELNVALGGALCSRVHEVEGRFDHRSDYNAPANVQFAPAHTVQLSEGGYLRKLADASEIVVNSLHSQGVSRLAKDIIVEAKAEDGQIEAVRVEGQPFAIGVQWHPEWNAANDRFSQTLFRNFLKAAAAFRASP